MHRTFLLALLCWSCSENPQALFDQDIPAAPTARETESGSVFPGPRVFPPEVYANAGKLAAFEDLFALDGVVRLETTDASMFGEVTDLLFHRGHWHVLDRMTHGVCQFLPDGRFVRRFGAYGEGPGELATPLVLRACFDGNLSVGDPTQGRIHVFDPQGAYLKTTDPRIAGKLIMPRFAYVWDREDRLYLAAFGSVNVETPLHAALDHQGQSWSIAFGFGTRIESVHRAIQKGSGTKPFTAFARIGERLWTGSPFTTHLDIFDLEGRFLGRLGEKIPRDPEKAIQPEDIEDIHKVKDPGAKMRRLVSKAANQKIGRIGDLVLVQVGGYLDVYDKNGNILAGNIAFKPFAPIFATGARLAMPVTPGLEPGRITDPDLLEALASVDAEAEDNPCLAVYKLRDDLFPQRQPR